MTYVSEPVASNSRSDGPDGAVAAAIAQELNADPSLKNSKITVQPVDNGIILTGVAPAHAQMQRAVQVATVRAGEGKVVNAIQSEEIVIQVPPPVETAVGEPVAVPQAPSPSTTPAS